MLCLRVVLCCGVVYHGFTGGYAAVVNQLPDFVPAAPKVEPESDSLTPCMPQSNTAPGSYHEQSDNALLPSCKEPKPAAPITGVPQPAAQTEPHDNTLWDLMFPCGTGCSNSHPKYRTSGKPSSFYYKDEFGQRVFPVAYQGKHMAGGVLLGADVGAFRCLSLCTSNHACLSVDYDSATRQCWMHTVTTNCHQLQPSSYSCHFQRVPCYAEHGNRPVQEVLAGNRGKEGFHCHCKECSVEECLYICSKDATCFGVNYHSVDKSCWELIRDNVCDLPVNDASVTLYRQTDCSESDVYVPTTTVPSTTAIWPTPFPAPQTNFTAIVYAGPSVLPSGYLAYPGQSMDGGSFRARNVTGDACLNICVNLPECQALCYSSDYGECYIHTAGTKCDTLYSKYWIYHIKKSPPCSAPYPAPVAIAP